MNPNEPNNTALAIVKPELARYLGVSVDDIDDDDSIKDDLHLTAQQIADFLEILEVKGLSVSKVDFNEIESVAELTEVLDNYNAK